MTSVLIQNEVWLRNIVLRIITLARNVVEKRKIKLYGSSTRMCGKQRKSPCFCLPGIQRIHTYRLKLSLTTILTLNNDMLNTFSELRILSGIKDWRHVIPQFSHSNEYSTTDEINHFSAFSSKPQNFQGHSFMAHDTYAGMPQTINSGQCIKLKVHDVEILNFRELFCRKLRDYVTA